MHDYKNDKMNQQQNRRDTQKFIENQNRSIFNNQRMTSTNNIKSNTFSVHNRNRSMFQDVKTEQKKINGMIGMQRDMNLREKQMSYQAVKDGQNRAKSNFMQMNNTMMGKNSSFYNERIQGRHSETNAVSQTTELLKKQEEELLAKLQRTYASEKKTIQALNDTVKKSPVRHTQMKQDHVVDFMYKPEVAIKKQMPIGGN